MWVDKFKIGGDVFLLDGVKLNQELDLSSYIKDGKKIEDLKILIFLQNFSVNEFGETVGYESYIEYKNGYSIIPRAYIKKRYKEILAENSLIFNNYGEVQYHDKPAKYMSSTKNKSKTYTYSLKGDIIENITIDAGFLAGIYGGVTKSYQIRNEGNSARVSILINGKEYKTNLPSTTNGSYWNVSGDWAPTYTLNYTLSKIPKLSIEKPESNNIVLEINTGVAYFKSDDGNWYDTGNAYIADLCSYTFDYTYLINEVIEGEVCLLIGV